MRDFEAKLEKYAEVIVRVGVNIQPGQRLLMWNPHFEAAPLVRAVTRAAYKAGAKFVQALYVDKEMTIARLKYGSDESAADYPVEVMDTVAKYAERGDALLSIQGLPPDYLDGVDPARIMIMQQSVLAHNGPYSNAIQSNKVSWSAVRSPTKEMADKVLPDVPENERLDKMWELVFQLSRADGEDPLADWQAHTANLARRKDYLNAKRYKALTYKGPGTDLRIGLPAGHVWESGQFTMENGVKCVANIPTEEAFTMPDRLQVDGVVRSTMPLALAAAVVEDFSLTFERGKVVKAEAKSGLEFLENLMNTDENARFLGEVALVPHSSPISQSGRIFFDTLYDENASCHIALGSAYPESIEGGNNMSEEEFTAAGGNVSKLHLDFMIGSDEIDIDGITQDGGSDPLMRAGEWVEEV